MPQLACFLHRSRLERYADSALSPRMTRSVEQHLTRCPDCREEVDRHVGLRTMVQSAVAVPGDPDWSAFWPGIEARLVRDQPRPRAARDPWWGPLWKPVWGHPKLALSGAMAACLVLAFSVWPGRDNPKTVWADPVEVQDVATADPERAVMVYSDPDQDQKLTVIWLFPGGENPTDES